MSYLKSFLDARNITMEDVIKASNDLPRRTMSEVMDGTKKYKLFVDHTASVNLNGQIIDVHPSYIGRWVYVYLPGAKIVPVAGSSLPKRRRLFLMACFLTGQSPECFPKGATLQSVVARWRQGFEAFEHSAEKEVIEISGGFEASPASRKRSEW